MNRVPHLVTRGLLVLGLLGMVACGGGRDEIPPELDEPARRPKSALPEALMVRFQEVKGSGSSRESWELEVLQMGSDVRVRGSVRTGGRSVPMLRVMPRDEYVDFWQWIRPLPYDRAQLVENETAPATDWRKTLQVDVVLDATERRQSRNTWTRPLVDAAWVEEVEHRLHLMALDLAEAEVQRQRADRGPGEDPTVETAVQEALRALGDGEASNLPGGSPDAD